MTELTDISEKVKDNTTKKPKLNAVLKKDWKLLAKVLELVLSALCLWLLMEPAKRGELAKIHLDHLALVFATFIGYILISSIFIFAKVIGDRIPYRVGFIFSVLASSLYFASGILLAIDRKKRYFYDDIFYEPKPILLNLLAASAAFSFLCSIIFGVEAVYTWKLREDF